MMIKDSIKKFFSNFKYFFMVLGIMFFALLIGLSVLYTGTKSIVTAAGSEIVEEINNTDLSMNRIKSSLLFESDEPLDAAINGTIETFQTMTENIKIIIGNKYYDVIMLAAVFLIIQILSWVAGHDTIYFLARYDKNEKKFPAWLKLFIKNIIVLGLIALIGYVYYKNMSNPENKAALIMLCAFPVVYCFISLVIEWIAAGKCRPAFKDAVSIKNILILLLNDIIVLTLAAAVGLLLVYIAGVLVGIFGVIAILIIGMASVTINAAVFVLKAKEAVANADRISEDTAETIKA